MRDKVSGGSHRSRIAMHCARDKGRCVRASEMSSPRARSAARGRSVGGSNSKRPLRRAQTKYSATFEPLAIIYDNLIPNSLRTLLIFNPCSSRLQPLSAQHTHCSHSLGNSRTFTATAFQMCWNHTPLCLWCFLQLANTIDSSHGAKL